MDFYKNQKYLSILEVVLIICWLILLDYKDFSWNTNGSAYLGIASMICLLASQIITKRKKK